MNRETRYDVGMIVIMLLFAFISGTGIASAAVAGDFSSSYDVYNDGESTDVPGHEIKSTGTLEFSGENAVNPTITIQPSSNTVLDDSSVQLQQNAGSSVDFSRTNYDSGVRYSADEIPANTDFEVSFIVYPVSGLDKSEIKSGEIVVRYERPSGETETKTIEITTALNNTPPQVISNEQASQNDDDDGAPIWMQGLSVVGGIAILFVLYDLILGSTDDPI